MSAEAGTLTDEREKKVRRDFDAAVEDVHRAFCDPSHELVGEWDRDMAGALRRNGYVLSRVPSMSTDAVTERLGRAMHDARGAYGEYDFGDCRCRIDAEAWMEAN